MAIKFNTATLDDNNYGLYELNKFNGVDYTTTPTQVEDTRAIEISNYIPEGNALVKRYGYSWLQRILHYEYRYGMPNLDNKAVYDAETLTYNGTTYLLKDTTNEYRVVEYKNWLVVFLGRKLPNLDKYHADILFLNKKTFVNEGHYGIGFDDYYTDGFWDDSNLSNKLINKCNGYKCSRNPIVIKDNKIWAFVFGDYFEIEYDNKIFITRYVNGTNQITMGSNRISFSTRYIFDDSGLVVGTYKPQGLYTPTTILNFQPIDSNSKSVKNEQLNILNVQFEIEFLITFKQGSHFWELVNTQYDVGSIYPDAEQSVINNYINLIIPPDKLNEDSQYYKVLAKWNAETKTTELSLVENTDNNTPKFDVDLSYTSLAKEGYPTLYGKPPHYEVAEIQGEYAVVKYKITFNKGYNTAGGFMANASSGILYGINNSSDRFFVSNGNIDYHTLDNKDFKSDFTYFGEETYTAVGSSQSEIIGYQILNNGSLAIFKDDSDDTNIFIRNGKVINTNEQYQIRDYYNNDLITYDYIKSEEVYSTISSGLLIKPLNKDTKFCLYDNKLIFNTKFGVYYLNLNSSTSTPSYSAKELSYYIRNDFGEDISDSHIETDGKFLYVARKNKSGQLRIYVADKNNYSFINSEQQYNWWVIDSIPVDYMFTLDNMLYFFDKELNLYKFIDKQLYDYCEFETESSTIGGTTFNTELMFDTLTEKMIISPESDTFNKLFDTYKYNANIYEDDYLTRYNYIKDNVKIKNSDLIMSLDEVFENVTIEKNSNSVISVSFSVEENENNKIEFLNYVLDSGRNITVYDDNNVYVTKIVDYSLWIGKSNSIYKENYNYYFDSTTNKTMLKITLFVNTTEPPTSTSINDTKVLFPLTDEVLSINELYTADGDKLSDYTYNRGWVDYKGDRVNYMLFNQADLSFKNIIVNFYNEDDTQPLLNNSKTSFYIEAPILSKWYGKFTDFGRKDILKTTKSIHFVPETRRGGLTAVGYRSRKKEKYYETNDAYLNFNDVDFENFSFEGDYFAKSYSSKKKIKNFSFLQLRFVSNDRGDSTIASLVIKYLYGKNNKGVK